VVISLKHDAYGPDDSTATPSSLKTASRQYFHCPALRLGLGVIVLVSMVTLSVLVLVLPLLT